MVYLCSHILGCFYMGEPAMTLNIEEIQKELDSCQIDNLDYERANKELNDRVVYLAKELSGGSEYAKEVERLQEIERNVDLVTQQWQQRVQQLEQAYHHMHVNSQDGTDTCKACGFDLRDPLHMLRSKER